MKYNNNIIDFFSKAKKYYQENKTLIILVVIFFIIYLSDPFFLAVYAIHYPPVKIFTSSYSSFAYSTGLVSGFLIGTNKFLLAL